MTRHFLMMSALLLCSGIAISAEIGTERTPTSPATTPTAQTSLPEAKTASVSGGYLVGPGDVLEISVWKEEGLAKDVLVRPDGGMTFPLVGEIRAGGKTIDQIHADLAKGLSSYLSEPAVSVAVKLVNQKFYVVGKVNKPGEFLSPARVDVMQALSMAGGLNPFADDDDIRIIRREGDRVISLPFDYGAVSSGDNLDQNIVLRRGDVVVVP